MGSDTNSSTGRVPVKGYVVTSGVLMGSLAAGDVLLGAEAVSAAAVLGAFGVGVLAGAIVGLVSGAVLTALSRVPWWAAAIVWLSGGAGLAAWLVDELAAIGQLGGEHHDLAVIAIAASVAAGLGATLVMSAMQPTRRRPLGFLVGLRWPFRAPASVLALAAAAGAVYADRTLMVGTYPSAHAALRWSALGLASVSALCAYPWWWSPPRRVARVALVVVGLIAILPVLLLRRDHYLTLSGMRSEPFSRMGVDVVRALGDFDLDGYSTIVGGGDCRGFDPDVHPGAREIPENGIDDNCRLGDAKPRPKLPRAETVPVDEVKDAMSVALITIDTVRADHMGAYGEQRKTTPRIDKWAEQHAVRFDRAYTSGGWTSLALSSMFRGVYPRRLRWTRLYETSKWRLIPGPIEAKLKPGERTKKIYGMPLREPRKPLAWWMRRRGFHTVAVTDDGFSEFLSPELGASEGFDVYIEADDLRRNLRNDRGVSTKAVAQLRKMPKGRPFFLWAHFFGPHNPSKRHGGVPRFGDSVEDRYHHELAFADKHVGRLLHALMRMQTKRKVAIIVASDHGEIVRRNWRNHGINLSEESIHIPLFLHVPGLPAGSTERLASLVDVMPTVLAVTGGKPPYPQDGVDLRTLVESTGTPDKRVVLSEFWRYDKKGVVRSDQVAATDGEYKLEWNVTTETKKLWRTVERYNRTKHNYLGKVEVPHLEDAVARFLEEDGQVQIGD